jgi:glycosyl transferase family 25
MRAMVVSLTSAVLRRAYIDEQFTKLELNYAFFDAINREEALKVCENLGFNYSGDITLGELGCLLSHIMIWQQMIANDDPYVMVFEDDVVLSKNIHSLLKSLDTIMEQCCLLKLETMGYPVKTSKPIITMHGYQVHQLQSDHMGTASYVITLNGAKKIIDMLMNEPIKKPIDHYMFDDIAVQSATIFQVQPALAIQEDVLNKEAPRILSDLESERHERLYGSNPTPSVKQKLTLAQKTTRELNRTLNQINPATWPKRWKAEQLRKAKKIIAFE